PADELWCDDPTNRARSKKRVTTYVDKPSDSRRRVISVKRAENKMPGQACIDCDACSLEVANLADHNDVWRLTQDRAQSRRKRHSNLRIDLHLIDPGHLIFDRLFHRDDLTVGLVNVIEAGVKCARLSRAGGAGNEKNPIGELDQAFKNLLVVGKKSKLGQSKHQAGFVQHAHDHALAMIRWDRRDPKIDRFLFNFDLDATVLGQTLLGDTHRTSHDLETADNGRLQTLGW